jgi:hypothetical protein
MGYPSGAQSFTSKNAGDTIQPSHINDLQTEVTAIENALITGPITLPASTLASLSVTGGSTFASDIKAASTAVSLGSVGTPLKDVYCSSLYVGGSPVVSFVPAASKMRHSVNQEATNVTWVGVNWDTEVYDSPGFHSTSVNSSRITLTSTGVYSIGALINLNCGTAGGVRRVRLVVNDSTTIIGGTDSVGVAGVPEYGLTASGQFRASATTDYVTVQVYQGSGSSGTIFADSTVYGGSAFWAERVST